MKTYSGKRLSPSQRTLSDVVVVVVDDAESGPLSYELTPEDSLRVRNHSPTGFNWGYGGSGPAQLALAILLDLYGGDAERATRNYQHLKFDQVAGWGDEWRLTEEEITALELDLRAESRNVY